MTHSQILEAILLLFESLIVGFSMAAPVGPVGVLCIRRSLHSGWKNGFTTGLGVAAADSLFGLIAGLGLTSVSDLLIRQEQNVRLGGGLLLLIVGWQIYRSQPKEAKEAVETPSALRQWRYFFSAFFLAVTNPLTVISFAAIYIGLGFGAATAESGWMVLIFVAGIFFGSSAWWFLLSIGTAHFRERITAERLLWVNKICGIAIVVFGAGTLLSFLSHMELHK